MNKHLQELYKTYSKGLRSRSNKKFTGTLRIRNGLFTGTVYMENGFLHRTDGPAIISKECKIWAQNGDTHSSIGPAIIWSDGSFEFFVNGQRHCETGPACVLMHNGQLILRFYYKDTEYYPGPDTFTPETWKDYVQEQKRLGKM